MGLPSKLLYKLFSGRPMADDRVEEIPIPGAAGGKITQDQTIKLNTTVQPTFLPPLQIRMVFPDYQASR